MLHELLSIFRSGNPLKEMADEFGQMLELTCQMTLTAGDIFLGKAVSSEARTSIYSQDVRVNKFERQIRKRVVAHLSTHRNSPDLPYCLLLMSLVKDVERLGDYAKNLSEIADLYTGELPDDEIVAELKEIRAGVEEAFRASVEIFPASDRERALTLIRVGKVLAQRSDGLLPRIAKSSYPADVTTAVVLGARYYKRIGGHVLNLLSSVVMPLHKIDYYDEDEVPAPSK
jgi:phosphate transport system protein